MGIIYTKMVEYFTKGLNWRVQEVPDRSFLVMDVSGKNGQYKCFAEAREAQHQFVFYTVCPVKAAVEKREAVSEFVTRANYGLIIGNFEMDYNDGEIRYKTSLDVENDTLSPALFRNTVSPNLFSIDKYMPGIMALLYAGLTPEQAVAKVENE